MCENSKTYIIFKQKKYYFCPIIMENSNFTL